MNERTRKSEALLQAIAEGELRTLNALVQTSTQTHETNDLNPEAFQLAEIAALVAVDASPIAWFAHFGGRAPSVEVAKIVGALVAVTPIVGFTRVVTAAANIITVTDLVDEIDDADLQVAGGSSDRDDVAAAFDRAHCSDVPIVRRESEMNPIVKSATGRSAHKRRVNDLIHESLNEHRKVEPVAFFCECPAPRCFDTVWLTTAEYETGRQVSRWSALAPGHYVVAARPGVGSADQRAALTR